MAGRYRRRPGEAILRGTAHDLLSEFGQREQRIFAGIHAHQSDIAHGAEEGIEITGALSLEDAVSAELVEAAGKDLLRAAAAEHLHDLAAPELAFPAVGRFPRHAGDAAERLPHDQFL